MSSLETSWKHLSLAFIFLQPAFWPYIFRARVYIFKTHLCIGVISVCVMNATPCNLYKIKTTIIVNPTDTSSKFHDNILTLAFILISLGAECWHYSNKSY